MAHVNLNDVQEKLGLDAQAVRKHVQEGSLQPFRTKAADGSHQVCFREEDVEALAVKLGVKKTQPTQEDDLVLDLDLDLDHGGRGDTLTLPDGEAATELDLGAVEAATEKPPTGPAATAPASDDISFDIGDDAIPGVDEPTTLQEAKPEESQDATIELDFPSQDDTATKGTGPATKTDVADGSETISFDLDGDNTLSLPDETLTLTDDPTAKTMPTDGATQTVGIDEGGEDADSGKSHKAAAAIPSAPVTKIVNEPNIHVLWGILTLLTFGVIVYLGLVNFGLVRLEGSPEFLGNQPTVYKDIADFVKNNFYYPN